MSLTVTTWNINSVRARIHHAERFLKENAPDVLCLQETKVVNDSFPTKMFEDLGYRHYVINGIKAYNGVAIFAKQPITPLPVRDWTGKADGRYLAARIERPSGPVDIHNFYVPAGGDVPDRDINDKFGHKLDFVTEMAEWGNPSEHARSILVGDLNIAPLETDVWNHKSLLKVVSHTPVEVEHLEKAKDAGEWVDTMRKIIPADERLYTWWSYRSPNWEKADKGRRLDHIWAGKDLGHKVTDMAIIKDARGWEKPSDHAPVIGTFDI